MFHGGRQVFQVGQAPSGPTVIRPLVIGLCAIRQKHKATFIVARSLVLADLLGEELDELFAV